MSLDFSRTEYGIPQRHSRKMPVPPETLLIMPSTGTLTTGSSGGAPAGIGRLQPQPQPQLNQQQQATTTQRQLLKKRKRQPATSHGGDGSNTPEEAPTQRQTFYFVDQNSSSSEKRSHVMRHHVQEKRRQRRHLNRSSCDWQHDNRIVQYRPRQGILKQEETIGRMGVSRGSNSKNNVRGGRTALSIESSSNPPPSLHLRPSPDPLETLPRMLSDDELELVDYWTNRLCYWSGQNQHIKQQILRAAMRHHRLALQVVILTYSARWRARLCDDISTSSNIKEWQEARYHLSQATRIVKGRADESIRTDKGGLAMALTSLAIQEERFGSKDEAEKYLSKATRITRSRAGCNETTVEVFHLYVRYIMSPPLYPHPHPHNGAMIDEEGQRWLVTFLRGAEELMKQHSTKEFETAVPERREAFRMEKSALFPLLASGPRPSRVPQERRKYVVERPATQEVCRSAALIYITAALWDFRNSPDKTRRFLGHLSRTVKNHGLDRDPACETFLWLLLEERYEEDLKDRERGWSTGALLAKHKQLQADQQFHFNEILMSFLMMDQPIRGIDAFEGCCVGTRHL